VDARDDDEMTCDELVELVTDSLEGALADGERAQLETHLAGCDGCTAYLEQMRTTIRLTGMLTEEHVPAEGRGELLRLFHAWRAGQPTA
jgi:anti-sigma factor RsiW